MSLLHAILLGFVEGITEFLPISSTGHMVLVSAILHIPQTEFVKTFEISIQLGAILAVLCISWPRLWGNRNVLRQVFFAFVPTAIIGFVLYSLVKKFLLGNPIVTVIALIAGGLLMLCFEWYLKQRKQHDSIPNLSLPQSVVIGLTQALAVIPGISRSAATIYSGMFVGLTREQAVEFSFLLALPTIAAASALDLFKSRSSLSFDAIELLVIGGVVAFISAFFTMKWFLRFVKTNTLVPFAIYRIVIGLMYFVMVH